MSSIVADVINIPPQVLKRITPSSITGTRRLAIADLHPNDGVMFYHLVSRTQPPCSPVNPTTKQNPTGLEAESLDTPDWRTAAPVTT